MSKLTAMVKLSALVSTQEARKAPKRRPCSDASVVKLAAALGAYTADSAADVVADDQIIQALARNRNKHPFHYALNPFVGGPISEIGHRLDRRVNAARATSPTMRVMSAAFPLNPLSLAGYPLAGLIGGAKRQDKARGMYEERIAPYDSGPGADEADTKRYAELAEREDAGDAKPKKEKEKKAGVFKPDGPYAVDQAARVLALDKLLAGNRYNRERHPGQWMLNPLVGGPLAALRQTMQQRNAATKATSPTAAVVSNIPLGAVIGMGDDGLDIGVDVGSEGVGVDDMGNAASTALGGAKRRHDARQVANNAGVGKPAPKKGDKKDKGGDKK